MFSNTWYIQIAKIKPEILNIKGINLILKSKNSLSKYDICVVNWNNDEFHVSTPRPRNKSLNKKPIKILPNPKINNGISIMTEDSCALEI